MFHATTKRNEYEGEPSRNAKYYYINMTVHITNVSNFNLFCNLAILRSQQSAVGVFHQIALNQFNFKTLGNAISLVTFGAIENSCSKTTN